MASDKKLGVIAGGGSFPLQVAQNARKQGYRVAAAAFEKETLPEIQAYTDQLVWLKLGQLGKLIRFLHQAGVSHVVFAGPINKPRAFDLRPDFRAIKLLVNLRSRNDNALLSSVADELHREGFEVVSAIEFVPELISPAGLQSRRAPSFAEKGDILFAWPIVKQIGSLDIGQCIVVKERAVVAVEAIEGTDRAILRAGELSGSNLTVVKIFKPGQDQRIDLPALGSQTVRTMVQAGATCLAYEAGTSLFFDRAEAISLADKHKICLVGIDTDNPEAVKLLPHAGPV
ncbi:UDP-2,3-diacylglucosamine diphosphatase LpxI [Desulfonatronospira sp.]|uniref:LpxI family protein n=1 Tax=Desulfonatronospira sp. TaxID=1962951 RepID=UPI0025C6C946|nr:UDP-2,3-diacylglucosamine diphosphatase LpxI [Desulfonatronospira sp.]